MRSDWGPTSGTICRLFLHKDFYEGTLTILEGSICVWLQMNIGDFSSIFPDG